MKEQLTLHIIKYEWNIFATFAIMILHRLLCLSLFFPDISVKYVSKLSYLRCNRKHSLIALTNTRIKSMEMRVLSQPFCKVDSKRGQPVRICFEILEPLLATIYYIYIYPQSRKRFHAELNPDELCSIVRISFFPHSRGTTPTLAPALFLITDSPIHDSPFACHSSFLSVAPELW